ncbi:isocitrate/isopropylmalate family dehydrogenase [Mycobacterium ostraviense]|uniref:isocitrate/isopropylmalate family dehydrogenase n=1 Tax=Mycobacterium ostraviense TaxID=2738409 RepID=UPI001912A956|nr:isocitrate/isopropylmalate family dehydrogenase [Mycobacterium ostraviense]UGT91855.1 hypothetical protein LTS72_27875 [Mycobacterium ostraviense]
MTTECRVSDLSEPVSAPATPSAAPVTVAHGDGIGPEIMRATLDVLSEAGARLVIEEVQLGEAAYLRGQNSGIEPEAWESLRRTRVFLKAPITTPQGQGFKPLNVTVRKTLGLYANVRPCVAYAPFVPTRHPGMDGGRRLPRHRRRALDRRHWRREADRHSGKLRRGGDA